MNREIKFRGKSLHTGEWHYGSLMQVSEDACYIHEPGTAGFFTDTETVGQFTGLYDRNGKEIYEGDIVRIYDGERCFNIVVKWSKEAMAFMACYCDGNQSPLSWFSNLLSRTHEIEVIGNIYDNPNY